MNRESDKCTVDLLLSIDSKFVMQMMVTAVSLFRNNKGTAFRIHLLCTQVGDSDKARIRQFVEQEGHSIQFYDATQDLIDHQYIPRSGRLTLSTYMRCFITRILPDTLHKILYMDCDLLVRSSIAELWQTDLTGHAIAAVDDMWARRGNSERLGIPAADSYFNNGVLLINLDRWREIDVYQQSMHIIQQRHDVLQFHDQDIFNILFHAERLHLPVRFNMQDAFYRQRRQWIQPELLPEIDQWLANPVVVHFTGSHKPWEYKCYHPFRREYLDYIRLTPFADTFHLPKGRLKDVIETHINPILWQLGLIRRKYRKR